MKVEYLKNILYIVIVKQNTIKLKIVSITL